MSSDFTRATHTIVVSDLHLADAEPPHPHNPLWKRFKRPKYFLDRSFKLFLEHLQSNLSSPIELVLNGDIFDFDSVMALPKDRTFRLNWLEKKRGMRSEEAKSQFKIRTILSDHSVWVESMKEFVARGNRVIFVIGNHDVELHWPTVQQEILSQLGVADGDQGVRFCEWFYVSNQDTLIEHGNQYDSYCLCPNPISPLIRKGRHVLVRLPFGNLAGRYMLNGMGLMNPHSESSYIKNTLWEYGVWYYRYVIRTQPLLMFTWFWSALVTLGYSVQEGLLPAMTDPLTIDERVERIALKSNASARMIWSLRELHVHPAALNPLKLLRELWLDRAILLAVIVFGSFQFFSVLNVFVTVSIWWFVIPLLLALPLFIFYARSVQSEVAKAQSVAIEMAPVAAQIARVTRVVHGHTHIEQHTSVRGIDYLNTGTWSPAYEDVECMKPLGRKCYAWIKPTPDAEGRTSELYEWTDEGPVLIHKQGPSTPALKT